jgi:hypothetical protein
LTVKHLALQLDIVLVMVLAKDALSEALAGVE